MVDSNSKKIRELIREEFGDFPESEEKEEAVCLAIQMVENESYTVAEATAEVSIELERKQKLIRITTDEQDINLPFIKTALLDEAILTLSNQEIQKIEQELRYNNIEDRRKHYSEFYYDAEDQIMKNLRVMNEERGLPLIPNCVVYFPQDDLFIGVSEHVERMIGFQYNQMSFNDEINIQSIVKRHDENCGTLNELMSTSSQLLTIQ